jgi:hypothetical protein
VVEKYGIDKGSHRIEVILRGIQANGVG